jgi:Na+-transporting methylmalonyl-CoA/oxaloacetate decarboxylase gamma subunit
MGVGAVVATLGVVLAFLLLLIAVVWYPIKRLWNRLFRRKT